MANSNEIRLLFKTLRVRVERVGQAHLNVVEVPKNNNSQNEALSDDDDTALADEFIVDVAYLKSLDPKEWKDQDHYKILGLGHLRFNATDDDIRRAYRRMVLQHHPDKRKAKGEEVDQDTDYFTCITKAYEILGTVKNRRAYDSVDPEFDDALPTDGQMKQDFYGVFNKYFKLNARWSERKNVPEFGDENAKRDDVENFYNFWYDFKSWREFSYLDEEDKDRGQDRDERRWIEKENKAARIKRKKEESQRIRALVDLAYNNDKRIAKFKEEDKQRKLAAKRAKVDAVQAARLEQERAARELQLERERLEKAEQKRIEQIRIEREQMKRALKKERKILRDHAKECNYFTSGEKELIRNMEGVERICEQYKLTELQELNRELLRPDTNSAEIYYRTIKALDNKLKNPNSSETSSSSSSSTAALENNSNNKNNVGAIKEVKKSELWTDDNLQLLVKAVSLFPAGTAQRWDVVSAFINQHATNGITMTARDVLNKAKSMQQSDFSKSALKQQVNETAYENFEKKSKKLETKVTDDITVNNNHINDQQQKENQKENVMMTNGGGSGLNGKAKVETTSNKNSTTSQVTENGMTNGVNKAWTKEEQALLEQAMKTYPNSIPDRWDRIASCIPNRSKKDCLRRVKELVELVNAKKEAQMSVK